MIQELITNNLWFLYLVTGLFSLAVGSFLNVVIYRLPIMIHNEWREHCGEVLKQKINLCVPRSFCPACNTMVKAWHNIPVFSYLFLKGRCPSCKHAISIRYPLIELTTMFLSLFTAWHFGFTLQLPFVLLAIWLIIPLIFIDLDHQLLPDSLTLGLLWLGLIANTQGLFADLSVAVLSCAAAYLSLWFFIKLFYLITGKVGMGHGDFKLFAAFGAWFGWEFLPLILLLSSLLGTVVGSIYLKVAQKSRNTTIPFGPFLCFAGLVSMFWGEEIIRWYLHFILKFNDVGWR